MRSARARPLALLAALALGAPAPAAGTADRGVELVIDRADAALRARDARGEARGPTLRVVTGSPEHPTPTGVFAAGRVILSPGWVPGDAARDAGAEREPPSLRTPMGVAKIPFAEAGSIALHGGGDARLLGKPVSSGCVRASDADLLRLLGWLHERGVLGPARAGADGAIELGFRRPVRIAVR